MNANRRLQERKLPERIVLCKLGGEESSFVTNLSEDGLCFESLTPIEKTGVLQLRVSADLSGEIEATGQLAWVDSAKRTGGLRFLELSVEARDQIRSWLSETSASLEGNEGAFLQKRDKQADDCAVPDKVAPNKVASDELALYKPPIDKPMIWQETRISSTQLVPIERHQARTRRHFLLGVFIGFGIGTLVMIAIFQYAGGAKPASLALTTASANSAAQSSAEQTQASTTQPVEPGASISKAPVAKPLATKSAAVQTAFAAAPTRSPLNQNQIHNKVHNPPSAGASTNLLARSSPPARNDEDTAPPATPAERVANSQRSTNPGTSEPPLGASEAAVASAPLVTSARSPSPEESPVEGQVQSPAEGPVESKVQHPKKVSATPEQLWSALQKGNVKAAVALADLYARGEGVPVNCQQARILLQIASEKKNAAASKKLQELDKGGCPPAAPPSEPKS